MRSTIPPPEPVLDRDGLDALSESLLAPRSVAVFSGPLGELALALRHAGRLLDTLARPSLSIDGRLTDEPWRELAAMVSVKAGEATALASELVARLAGHALVVLDPAPSAWGGAVAEAIAAALRVERGGPELSLVVLTPRPDLRIASVPLSVSRAGLRRVVEARIDVEWRRANSLTSLVALEQWWNGLGRSPQEPVSHEAGELLEALRAIGRHYPLAAWREVGTAAARRELLERGLVREGHTGIGPVDPATGEPNHGAAVLAVRLLDEHAGDAWALARLAELLHLTHRRERAERAALDAIRAAPDVMARSDLWQRFLKTVFCDASDASLATAAEVAFAYGNPRHSVELVRRIPGHGDRLDLSLLAARASHRDGDIATSAASLDRGLDLAVDKNARALVHALYAHVLAAAGDHEGARPHAHEALAATAEFAVHAEARNALAIAALDESRMLEAAEMFDADAKLAAEQGELAAEERALHNRAVALMQIVEGREEALRILESLVLRADESGNTELLGRALQNLSVVAAYLQDYGKAVDAVTRALHPLRAHGQRRQVVTAQLNLVQYRLAVGQRDEASDVLAEAREALRGADAGPLGARLAHRAALLAWERGQLNLATEQVELALATAARGKVQREADPILLTAAHIALDTGEPRRAAAHLAKVESLGPHRRFRGSAELIALRLREAGGEVATAHVERAIGVARAEHDAPAGWWIHAIAGHAAAARNQSRVAKSHLRAGLALRDEVLRRLPAELQASFFLRRDLAELAELEEELGQESARTRSQPRTGQRADSDLGMVGQSRPMRALRKTIRRVAPSEATVLVYGESGTGKELIAEAMHAESRRADGPLVKVNCAALMETLLLSELFGHEKGSFTGADRRRIGRFEQAHGGTIFLDEIGDISPSTQVALLRVLQDHRIERVGGNQTIDVDVRVICATHRNLPKLVEARQFRQDLYFRLAALRIDVPPLRERLDDLPVLAQTLLARLRSETRARPTHIAPDALERLQQYAWPGNVRELENVIRSAGLFAEGSSVTLRDLSEHVPAIRQPPRTASQRPQGVSDASEVIYQGIRSGETTLANAKRAIERTAIERALTETEGNITRAAELLGMKRPRLSQILSTWALDEGHDNG